MKNIFLIIFASSLFLGCQSSQTIKEPHLDNESFMRLWSTYSDCNTSNDLMQMNTDAVMLGAAANRSHQENAFIFPLPGKLEQFVNTPSTRLAVDVKAMSASCSLRAGQAAFEAQRFDMARELLQVILDFRPQSVYAFYSVQAEAILLQIEQRKLEVSLKFP